MTALSQSRAGNRPRLRQSFGRTQRHADRRTEKTVSRLQIRPVRDQVCDGASKSVTPDIGQNQSIANVAELNLNICQALQR